MGHCINHIVVEKKASREAVLDDISAMVSLENYQESYHGNLTWHDGKVYDDRSDAEAAISRFDNGWYDDHAVLFRDTDNLSNATIKRLEKQITETQEKKRDYINKNHVTSRKSAYIGCPHCGSKLSREHLRSDRCPVCHADLRSDTVLSRIEGYDKKIAEWDKKIRAEKKKLNAKAPVKWLVKYEFHI